MCVLYRNADLLQTCRPRTRFNRCGYLLHDVLTNNSLHLARMLVGSEGTLGIFTEVTLRTIPLPASRSLVLLGFNSLDAALSASQQTLGSNPAACDLIDRCLVTLARERGPEVKAFVRAISGAVLRSEYLS